MRFLACGILLLTAGATPASVTALNPVVIDTGIFAQRLSTVTTDLLIDFSGRLGSQQLWIDLHSGAMFNDPFGRDIDSDPPPTAIPPNPYDTLLLMDGVGLLVAAAVNIPGAPISTRADSELYLPPQHTQRRMGV